jgi:hypothetical protein
VSARLRLALATATVLLAALSAPATGVAAQRASTGPTAAQIRIATRRAVNSPNLWATVNICNTTRHPGIVGIRVQMPGLGFTARLYTDVRLEYWSPSGKPFQPVPGGGDSGLISLGRANRGTPQGGVMFSVKSPTAGGHYVFRGVATFEWKLSGRLLAKTVRTTGHGYKHVDFGDPAGHNAGTCTIG